MRTSFLRFGLSILVLLSPPLVSAQLLNISSGGLQSEKSPAIACTIIGSTGSSWRGMKAVVVLAESNSPGSNPWVIAELLENGETMANDTWIGPFLVNGATRPALSPAVFRSLLRAPYGAEDAALLVSVPLGWRLCVRSFEVFGGDSLRRVALSVTDVTDAVIRQIGASADHPVSVQATPAGTPNVQSTFARLLSAP